MRQSIDICLTPELIHQYELEDKIVVVVDILRATSCMVTGIAQGVKEIMPVSTLEECVALKGLGYFTAAERNGEKAEGFDMGNSPFEYMNDELKGEKVAVTTTNGTLAIHKSLMADEILIGERIRDIINFEKNSYLMVLEDTGSLGVLQRKLKR